ncbi:MAG: transposase [Clostridia bacterium]
MLQKICPSCESISTKKNGKDDSNQQRYLCNECKKSFILKTGILLY